MGREMGQREVLLEARALQFKRLITISKCKVTYSTWYQYKICNLNNMANEL